MKKTKVLYLITKGNWGGAQKYTYDLAVSQPIEKYDVLVGCGSSGMLKERLEAKNIRTIVIPELGRDISFFKDIKSFLALIKLLKREKPDIVHLNSSKIGILGSLAGRIYNFLSSLQTTPSSKAKLATGQTSYKLQARLVFTAHGWPFGEDRSALSKSAIKFFSWITVVLCHITITLHERDLHAFDRWPFTKNKVVKIYNGIRNSIVLERDAARKKLAEYNIPMNGPLIGTVAELHKNKGLPYLIEAIRKLPETVSLAIIGEGEEQKNLESLIRQEHLSSRVFLTGFIPEASKLLRALDLFILPSVKEGFPFVLLEAGNAHVPIVATTVGGIPEIIENKKEGLLVPPKNPAALAEAIQTLLNNKPDRESYAAALAKKIKDKFDFNSVTLPQTLALYKS